MARGWVDSERESSVQTVYPCPPTKKGGEGGRNFPSTLSTHSAGPDDIFKETWGVLGSQTVGEFTPDRLTADLPVSW